MKKLIVVFLCLLNITFVFSQWDYEKNANPFYNLEFDMKSESGDSNWTKSSCLFVPDVKKIYTESQLDYFERGGIVLSIGDPTYRFHRPKLEEYIEKYDQGKTEIISYSPEYDATHNKGFKHRRKPAGRIENEFSKESSFENYQFDMNRLAEYIPKLHNLKFAKIVYPNKQIIEALLNCSTLEYLLLIHPIEKLDELEKFSSLKTLYIVGTRNNTSSFPKAMMPLQLNDPKLGDLNKLTIASYSTEPILGYDKLLFPLNLSELRLVLSNTLADYYINQDLGSIEHYELKVAWLSRAKKIELKTKYLENLRSLKISSFSSSSHHYLFDSELNILNKLEHLELENIGTHITKRVELKDMRFPKSLKHLYISSKSVYKLKRLHKLNSLRTLQLQTHNNFSLKKRLKSKELEFLVLGITNNPQMYAKKKYIKTKPENIPNELTITEDYDYKFFEVVSKAKKLKELHLTYHIMSIISTDERINSLSSLERIYIHILPRITEEIKSKIDQIKERLSSVEIILVEDASEMTKQKTPFGFRGRYDDN